MPFLARLLSMKAICVYDYVELAGWAFCYPCCFSVLPLLFLAPECSPGSIFHCSLE